MKRSCFIAASLTLFLLLMVACERQLSDNRTSTMLPTSVATKAEKSVTPAPSLELLWGSSVVASDDWIDTALIDDGILYYSTGRFVTGQQHIGAFDLQSRQTRWTVSMTTDLPVMVENGYVLLIDKTTATLAALRSLNGSLAWRVSLPELQSYEATTGSGFTFVGSGDQVVAVDATTGEIGWEYILPQGFQVDSFKAQRVKDRREYSALTHDGKTLYVRAVRPSTEDRLWDCLLLALNAQNGKKSWTFPFVIEKPLGDEPSIATQPTFGDTGLLIFTWGGSGYFLGRTTGQLIWEKTDFGWSMGINPHIWNDRAIIEQYEGLTSLDIQGGQMQWSREIQGYVVSPLWIDDGMVFFTYGIEPASLAAIDLQTGDVVGEQTLSSLKPQDEQSVTALAGDSHTLYLVLARNVYAFSMP
jgi:outer membrane protein assembly factor BamB